jgi:hypothetical protein
MKTHEIIHEILLDMSLHPLIEDGMVNFSNKVHLRILEEKLTALGMDEDEVTEIIDKVVEGQFPDRQAFNKEGWLVTFPSPEYKQAAIKKGTHFVSDPTHGKGGMNLYYKKKGKQARMTQQDPSAVEPEEPQNSVAASADATSVGGQTAPATAGGSSLPPAGDHPSTPSAKPSSPTGGTNPSGEPEDNAQGGKTADSSLPASDTEGESASNSEPSAPATPTAPPPPPPPSFVNISVEFAKNKHWSPTPYGEWRNATGETAAVVALSGEVVPVKAYEREELKLLTDKKHT